MNTKLLSLISAAAVLGAWNAQAVDFEKEILPIFKERCFDCHSKEHADPKSGKMKKPKGKFRMDSAELLMKGGEEGKNIVVGKPEESTVYTSVCLPDSDDKAMPPEGKGERLTKAQQDLIKAWIADGAKFGDWKGAAD
jgi:uncharacterized membrane protein